MPRRFDWVFKELFLILSAPVFWAVLTNFGRVWRFIDDRYYHAKAKQWREDKREAKRLHKELIGHYDFYQFQLFGTTENCCRDVLAKLCNICRQTKKQIRRKKRRIANRWCKCCPKKRHNYKKSSKNVKGDKKEIVKDHKSKKSRSDDLAFTGISMSNVNKMYDAKKDDNVAVKDDDDKKSQEENLKNTLIKQNVLNVAVSSDSNLSKSNDEASGKEELKSSTSSSDFTSDPISESPPKNIFETPLRKGLSSIPIDTSPLDASENYKADKRWQTIGKHAVLRSKLAPTTPHAFNTKAETTHNVMYSNSFINQEEDY